MKTNSRSGNFWALRKMRFAKRNDRLILPGASKKHVLRFRDRCRPQTEKKPSPEVSWESPGASSGSKKKHKNYTYTPWPRRAKQIPRKTKITVERLKTATSALRVCSSGKNPWREFPGEGRPATLGGVSRVLGESQGVRGEWWKSAGRSWNEEVLEE